MYYNFNENYNNSIVPISNILLTGATGYLGIHILHDLIEKSNCIIYCLVRDKDNVKAKQRLMDKLKFYFGTDFLQYMDSRIKIVEGNVALYHFGLSNYDYKTLENTIDTVIHSAAIVSHYGDKDLFYKVNVGGTDNVINFCKANNIRMNHISTTSVSATFVPDVDHVVAFDEHCLYIGQNYSDNIYIKSKFEAEHHIYLAMQDGLIASIYRLGNITARLSDGIFQENNTQNAFLNRIVAFCKLRKIPQYFANMSVDLSPVDECSNIITSLFTYECSYGKVFHIFNNNRISVLGIIEFLDSLGKHIDIVSSKEFNSYVSQIPIKDAVLGVINDVTSDLSKSHANVEISSAFTESYMQNYGLSWSSPNLDYLSKFLGKYINE